MKKDHFIEQVCECGGNLIICREKKDDHIAIICLKCLTAYESNSWPIGKTTEFKDLPKELSQKISTLKDPLTGKL